MNPFTDDPLEVLKHIPVGVKTERGWTNVLELVPGRTAEIPGLKAHKGLTVHRLPKTGFVVAECHYSVEHKRREPGWAKASSAKYGRRGFRSYKWRQEMEIEWAASSGDPVYANWEPDVHVVEPFQIPSNWPRWLMYDPGGVNPHALEWWTMDPNPPLYTLYCYRQWYRGLKMPDRSEGTYYLATDVIRIAHEMSIDHLGHLERIDVMIMDPAARATKATAATAGRGDSGEQPTERAMTMYEEVCEVVDQLGWRLDVVTGNNLKDAAIDECIERLGNYPVYLEEDGDPVLDATGEPIPLVVDGEEVWVPPRLYVFRPCRWAAWEFGQYKWANWASDVVAEQRNMPEAPVDKNDHSMTNVIRLMNWIRRDDSVYDRELPPASADHAAHLLQQWRERRKEEYRALNR